MIGAAVVRMTQVARCERLRNLCDDLGQAIDRGDLASIASLDHAVRSAVMAMLGEGAPAGAAAEEELLALTRALASLQAGVSRMRALQGAALRKSSVRAVYLAKKAGRTS